MMLQQEMKQQEKTEYFDKIFVAVHVLEGVYVDNVKHYGKRNDKKQYRGSDNYCRNPLLT